MKPTFPEFCAPSPMDVILDFALQEADLIVNWARKVPGFLEIDLNDQATLLNAGVFVFLSVISTVIIES